MQSGKRKDAVYSFHTEKSVLLLFQDFTAESNDYIVKETNGNEIFIG